MPTSHALVVPHNGNSSVLEVQSLEVPTPGDGEVQVEVAAVGVNFIDVYQRQGVYPIPTPFVACSEGAGVVTAVGTGVSDVGVGDRVAWGQGLGAGGSRGQPRGRLARPGARTESTSTWPPPRCSRA